jgi:hypothetical protein
MGWAKLILGGAKLWLSARPFRKLKERRKAKRLERSSELIDTDEEDSGMNEWQQSLLRSLLKVAGTAAVTHGLIEAGQTDVLVTALEAIAGGLVTLGGLYWSHRHHKEAA